LAFINAAVSREPKIEKRAIHVSAISSVLIMIIVLFVVYATNIQPARANMATFSGVRSIFTERVDPIEAFQSATRIPSPHISDIRSDFVRNLISIISQYGKVGNTEESIALAEFLYEELQKNRELHPLDIRTHVFQAQISQAEAEFNQTPDLLFRAERDLETALEYSPKRQQLQYMLSTVKLQLRKDQEAVALLEESIANDPKIAEGWWRLAVVYQQVGDIQKAKQIIEKAQEGGVQFDAKGEEIATSILGL
jgi:tetratricopeptide (TPR) repeat protein